MATPVVPPPAVAPPRPSVDADPPPPAEEPPVPRTVPTDPPPAVEPPAPIVELVCACATIALPARNVAAKAALRMVLNDMAALLFVHYRKQWKRDPEDPVAGRVVI
jgi:hypothetical protein